MLAKAPGNSGKAIGVSAIQLILIIEIESCSKSILRGGAPFQYILAPVHLHIPVHLTCENHFSLPHKSTAGLWL